MGYSKTRSMFLYQHAVFGVNASLEHFSSCLKLTVIRTLADTTASPTLHMISDRVFKTKLIILGYLYSMAIVCYLKNA